MEVVEKVVSKIKRGISSNELKVIAITVMIIDHIGYYMSFLFNDSVAYVLRSVGRIAMPIFAFMVVEGFFYTKDFKKYLKRMGIAAVICQVSITICYIINKYLYPEYVTSIYKIGNILFTFFVSLIILKIIHTDILVKKWDINKNITLRIVLVLAILIITIFLPLDYSKIVPTLIVLLYFLKRFEIYIMINRERGFNVFSKLSKQIIKDRYIHYMYLLFVFIVMIIITKSFYLSNYTILSFIPIALYNGSISNDNLRQKNNKVFRNLFYTIFIAQHVILYILAMVVYSKIA